MGVFRSSSRLMVEKMGVVAERIMGERSSDGYVADSGVLRLDSTGLESVAAMVVGGGRIRGESCCLMMGPFFHSKVEYGGEARQAGRQAGSVFWRRGVLCLLYVHLATSRDAHALLMGKEKDGRRMYVSGWPKNRRVGIGESPGGGARRTSLLFSKRRVLGRTGKWEGRARAPSEPPPTAARQLAGGRRAKAMRVIW